MFSEPHSLQGSSVTSITSASHLTHSLLFTQCSMRLKWGEEQGDLLSPSSGADYVQHTWES